jgi:hypothetical protein
MRVVTYCIDLNNFIIFTVSNTCWGLRLEHFALKANTSSQMVLSAGGLFRDRTISFVTGLLYCFVFVRYFCAGSEAFF